MAAGSSGPSLLRRALLAGAILICGALAFAQVYVTLADDVDYAELPLVPDVTAVTLIFHGSQDAANPVFGRLQAGLAQLSPAAEVLYYRWPQGADNRARARVNALKLGAGLGEELAAFRSLQNIHLVMHSSGAYVGDALCEAYQQSGGTARVRMTFLDPFGLSGLFDFGHGPRTHGRCADFAVAIINTDDPAPATNRPLQQAWNLDVTAAAGRSTIDRNGHYWPPEYYLRHLQQLEARWAEARHAVLPRGAVEIDPAAARP